MVKQLRLSDAPDDKILFEAARLGRVVLTHDEEDFLLLDRAWRRWSSGWNVQPLPQHAGILLLPTIKVTLRGYVSQEIHHLLIARPSLANEVHAWQQTQWVQKP